MFLRKFLLLILGLMLFLSALPSAELSAQGDIPSDAPYIYYYSDWLDSFVIERADGSDSRLFGAGLIPDGTNMVGGGRWSPSGEWFVFMARHLFYGSHSKYLGGGVLNANGTRHIDLSWIENLEQVL